MSGFFLLSFILNIKKLAAKKALWVLFVLLPLAIFAGSIFVEREAQLIEVRAGVIYDHDSPFEARIFEYLSGSVSGLPFVRFIPYSDKDEMLKSVSLGRLDSAYIFNPNIDSAAVGDFSGIVTLVSSPRTVAAPILNDMVAAAILQAAVKDITTDGLETIFGESEELRRFINQQFEAYAQMDIFMTPDFRGEAHFTNEETAGFINITLSRIFHGLIGLTILILSMFFAPGFIEERRRGPVKALSVYGKLTLYDFSLWAAVWALSAVTGLTGVLAISAFAPQLAPPVYIGTAALAAYTALNSALFVLAVRVLKTPGLIHSFGIFTVLLNIFFGGVLLDLREISIQLARVQYLFPLYWYIQAILPQTLQHLTEGG